MRCPPSPNANSCRAGAQHASCKEGRSPGFRFTLDSSSPPSSSKSNSFNFKKTTKKTRAIWLQLNRRTRQVSCGWPHSPTPVKVQTPWHFKVMKQTYDPKANQHTSCQSPPGKQVPHLVRLDLKGVLGWPEDLELLNGPQRSGCHPCAVRRLAPPKCRSAGASDKCRYR